MRKKALRRAFLDTVPVMTGYVVLGIGFGILLQQAGYGVWWAFAMGLFVFAGSAQYMLVSLLAAHAPVLTVALTTLLLNARHIFYGLSMVDVYKGAGKKKPYLVFALTDETYSLVTQNRVPEGLSRQSYCLIVSGLDHLYWVAGCVLGSLAGQMLPVNFEGVEFVLTALFITMFVEQWLSTKEHRPAVIGVMSTALCLFLFGKDVFLVPSMVLIAALLLVLDKTGRRKEDG